MSLQSAFQLLDNSVRDTVDQITKATAPDLGSVTDVEILKLYYDLKFPSGARSINKLASIASRFFNLYFLGLVDSQDSVALILCDAIAVSEVSNKFIFGDDRTDTLGFYVSPEIRATLSTTEPEVSKLNAEIATKASKNMDAYKEMFLIEIQSQDVTAFKANIKSYIDQIDVTTGVSNTTHSLRSLIGFLAMTLCRAAVKNQQQLNAAFHKAQFKKNLAGVVGWSSELSYTPPSDRCLDLCVNTLQSSNPTTSQLFTLFTGRFIEVMTAGSNAPVGVQAYLSASVLTHTARNGLGIIQLLDQACIITSLSWKKIAEQSYYAQTASGWNSIAEFYKSQLTKGAVQHGYNWARIINNGYFRHLSPKSHLFLATILGAIVEKSQGLGIWDSVWAQGAVSTAAKLIGRAIYEESQPKLEQLQGTSQSESIAQKALRYGGDAEEDLDFIKAMDASVHRLSG